MRENRISKWILKIISGCVLLIFNYCSQANNGNTFSNKSPVTPETTIVQESNYKQILYVSKKGEDRKGNGSKEQPFKSVPFAIEQNDDASAENKAAIFISQGNYSDKTLIMKEYVDIYGGFKEGSWERDIDKYVTVLNGDGNRRIVIAANFSKIDGFFITDGIIRGQGGAVFCNGTSPTITNNTFYKNKTHGPDNWNPKFWHETAHDGGAIYGKNGSAAMIQNNLFVENTTENGRGAAISLHGQCKPQIVNNVFLSNIAGTNDPMRSSDGGAINIFDWCDALISGNVFISNKADSKNDGGAVFIALWSSAKVSNNIFVDNHAGDDAGALFVGGQEHRYDAPLDPLPPKEKFYVSILENTFIGNHHGGFNSGAMRFTMESRGDFLSNTVAHNNGIYFQRSEVRVANNIILDNFLLIETKNGLGERIVENNLIWAEYNQKVEAEVKKNNMLHPVAGNYSEIPKFIDDGMEITSLSTNYNWIDFSTQIITSGLNLKNNQLVNRVIRSGDKWSVVKSNTTNTIKVWGEFAGKVCFTILPTYTLLK
jgi:hypothetical protein